MSDQEPVNPDWLESGLAQDVLNQHSKLPQHLQQATADQVTTSETCQEIHIQPSESDTVNV